MGKTLGLDLGHNSIGWAIIDEPNNEILATGSRLFQAGVESVGTGREQSLNAQRREQRQARRQIFRNRLRRRKLLEYLIHFQMCPLTYDELQSWRYGHFPENNASFKKWLKLDPYEIRHRGILTDSELKEEGKSPITREELGRAFYHIIHHRGFKSSRQSGSEDQNAIYKGSGAVVGANAVADKIETYKTLGNYLYHIHPKEREKFHRQFDENEQELRVRARYTLREWYVREFEQLWDKNAGRLGLDQEKYTRVKRKYLGNPEKSANKQYLSRIEKKGYGYTLLRKGETEKDCDIELQIPVPAKSLFGDPKQGVLFYQRPLQSQKQRLSRCTLERFTKTVHFNGKKQSVQAGKPTCPVSHPLFELYRSYKFINSIEFDNQALDERQRQTVLEVMNSRKQDVNFSTVKDQLGLPNAPFNYPDDHNVPVNKTIYGLKNLIGDEVWSKPEKRDDLWHIFYYYNDADKLHDKLRATYHFSEDILRKANNFYLKEGNSSLSLKAIRNILPFLVEGYEEDKAILLGGVKNAYGKDKELNSLWDQLAVEEQDQIKEVVIDQIARSGNKQGEAVANIKEFLKGEKGLDERQLNKLYHHSQPVVTTDIQDFLPEPPTIRNPIVQQALVELKKLINSLSQDYLNHGEHFASIKLELARTLKQPRQARVKMKQQNEKNAEINQDARNFLDQYGLAHTRTNVQKYRLWEELQQQNGTAQCPYTGKPISIAELFGTGNQFQIEHIIPYSISLDDSLANKTLCEAEENGVKGDRTPYEFYGSNEAQWAAVKERAFSLLPYKKAKRFTQEKPEDNDEFIARQMNDTTYMSREAGRYLKNICEDVQVFPGQLTAELRRNWGLNNILNPGVAVHPSALEGQYWILNHEDNQQAYPTLYPVYNYPPEAGQNELVIPGEVAKGHLYAKFLKTSFRLGGELQDGNYWAKVALATEPSQYYPRFQDKPRQAREDEIVVAGQVEVKGKKVFSARTLKNTIPVDDSLPEGGYWATLPVNTTQLKLIDAAKQKPKLGKNQIVLFGKVSNGIFESYIYACSTTMPDGTYWAVLEVMPDEASFTAKANPMPQQGEDELLLKGIVKDDQFFPDISDADPYQLHDSLPEGAYWARIQMTKSPHSLQPFTNAAPAKPEEVTQGTVVKTENGKYFLPAKQRDDHRHHAVDALVVALTKRKYLQALSTMNAEKRAYKEGKSSRHQSFPLPWENFRRDAETAISSILVSRKKDRKVLTKSNKPVYKNGKRYKGTGLAARGGLHKDTIYGKRWNPQLQSHQYHVNVPISRFDTRKKIENELVDKGIRQQVFERVKALGGFKGDGSVPNGTFFQKDENGIQQPAIFLPNRQEGDPVPVKKARMAKNFGTSMQLKTGANAFVNPHNNHHIVVYRNRDNRLAERPVTFWEAVERQRKGQSAFQLPPDGEVAIYYLQINDYFLLNLPEHLQVDIEDQPYHVLSDYLYFIQKITEGTCTFTHHRGIGNISVDKYKFNPLQESFPLVVRKAPKSLDGIKVNVTVDGQLTF